MRVLHNWQKPCFETSLKIRYYLVSYDVDENGYLVSCEKEQSVIRLMKILRKKGNSYKNISEKVTKATRKKFPQSWVFNILNRESTIPPNKEIIRHNICNIELQPNICDV